MENPLAELQVKQLGERRIMATQALSQMAQKHTLGLLPQWTKGQKVWLNVKNLLCTAHQ
jgi:hypothetical protein